MYAASARVISLMALNQLSDDARGHHTNRSPALPPAGWSVGALFYALFRGVA